jgi:nitrite reductase/ring-hydroxylating ferredoxin subunit
VTDDQPTRRAALLAGAGGAGVLALAACSPRTGGAAQPTSQPAGRQLVALDAVPVGGAKSVSLPDGSPAVVARPTSTSAVCFSAVCTHEGCTVAPNGNRLDCPCHGSVFDALTGAVRNGPAVQPLQRISVRVVAGKVVTG